MIKVGLVSLGCAKNRVDGEMMLAMFPHDRFSLTNNPAEADLIIVNTCGFIEDAKKESIDTIFEMAQYPAKLVIVGCLAERYYEELQGELPEADLIVPIRDYQGLAAYLRELTGEEGILPLNPLRRVLSTAPYSAFLRISEGCDNFCSFCAIPHIRGRFRSRPFDEIIEEAKLLKEQGVKEISIISQDTTVYGKDFPGRKPNIVDLLKAIEEIGFFSIRLLYLYPSEISDDLIDLIASSKSIAHYFDIPVQCASDHLLKAMRRHADAKETRKLFEKIKKRCPDAVLRTTLIAGFPGENEEDQLETLDFLKEVKFDHMGCFVYSREEGTASYDYPDQVEEEIKEKRRDEIMRLQQTIAFSQAKKQVGKVYEGLVVGKNKRSGKYLFRCAWNAPDDIDGAIEFSSPRPLEEGEVVSVRITASFAYDLEGELAE